MIEPTRRPIGLLLSGLLLAPLSSTRALAAEVPLALPDIAVRTATRIEQDESSVLVSLSVITREEIRRSVAEDLLELLRLQAGVDVVRTGPAGAQTSVFLRGGNSDHVLVLIDGIRVASAHTGTYAWELLPLSLVERIEIVRGPRAALYGSDAIGGVIQVFTRQPDTPTARLTVGSFGTAELEAGLGAETARGRHSIHASRRRTDGFSAQNESGFSYHPDEDGFESSAAGVNGDVVVGDGRRWSYRVLASETDSEFDQGVSRSSQRMATLSWHGRIRPTWSYGLQAAYLDDRLESDFGFFASGFSSRRLELGWSNHLDLSGSRLGFGVEFIDESGRSNGEYDTERDNGALYALWETALGRVQWQVGARLDDNSEFGSEETWQAAAGIPLGRNGRLGLHAGTAFRAPGLGEQFSPGFGGFYAGNPDLEPESSRTVEINYRHAFRRGHELRAAAYRTDVDQLIAFTGVNFRAVNVARAELEGLEIEWRLRQGGWIVSANATVQDARNADSGAELLRRPRRKASFSLDREWSRGWLGADWFASGPRADVGGQSLPGYGILGFRAGWAINGALALELRLENALDKNYEPAAGFNSADRSVFLSVDWQP